MLQAEDSREARFQVDQKHNPIWEDLETGSRTDFLEESRGVIFLPFLFLSRSSGLGLECGLESATLKEGL